MKKNLPLVWLCCYLFAMPFASAQNLVLNPSFEITSGCPGGISEFALAVDWTSGNTGQVSCSSTDLYSSCSSLPGGANSPNALLGYQQSRTDSNHAGIILAEGMNSCSLSGSNYREYLEGRTSAPLVAGQSYIVRFYVNLPDDVMAGSDDIGVYFSNTLYTRNACTEPALMNLVPQLNYCGPCILDTTNWVELKWLYTANGGEQYFIIGNFKSDTATTVCPHRCSVLPQNPYIYYYIDDVEISAATPNQCAMAINVSTTNTGCDTSNGTATVQVTSCNAPFQYTWSTGSQNASITGLAAGSYAVTVTDGLACSATALAEVNTHAPTALSVYSVNYGCNIGSVVVTVLNGTGPFTYLWSNGSTLPEVNNLPPGTYTVTVTGAGGCTALDSATVEYSANNLTLTVNSTPAFCGNSNGTAMVSAGSNVAGYLWSNGQTAPTATGLAPGVYSVTATPQLGNLLFYTENFTSGGTGWTFADGPGINGPQSNLWAINSISTCQCGIGNFLHVTCNPANLACSFNGGADCNYFHGVAVPNPLIGDPTADKCAVSPAISTVGKSNMVLKFKYAVGGDVNLDYGLVRFSGDNGVTWLDMPTRYTNQPNCTSASINIPSAFEDKPNFKFAFRWINNNDGDGVDPGFSIDSIRLFANASACPAAATVAITDSNSFAFTTTFTAANCGQSNGTALAIPQVAGNYTYAWSNGGATDGITNLSGGNYDVTVSQGANCSASASVTVPAFTGLPVTVEAIGTTCGENNGSVNAVVSGIANYTYAWSNGSTNAGAVNLAPGNYTVTASNNGCSGTASATIVQSATPAATFIITQPGCGLNNGSITLATFSGAQPVNILWMAGSTNVSNDWQVTSLVAGLYNLHIIDSLGCAYDTAFILNSVNITSPTITTTRTVLCTGDVAHICAPSGYSSYLWSTSQTSSCINTSVAGNFGVTVSDNANCSAVSNQLTITSALSPSAVISVNGSSLQTTTPGTYQWYLNGQPITGAVSATYTPIESGAYSVEVTNPDGCSDFSGVIQFIYNSIHNIAELYFRVYPNPLQNCNFTLEISDQLLGSSAEIFDATGRLVYRAEVAALKSEINMVAAPGVYTLRISSGGNVVTRKLIKL